MNKKKVVSQILVLLIFFVIIIVAVSIQNNNIDTKTNSSEYENLNINQNELNIFYLDVGQGNSTFITINGCNMLIDSGNDQDGYYIVQFLKAQNIDKIDYFILFPIYRKNRELEKFFPIHDFLRANLRLLFQQPHRLAFFFNCHEYEVIQIF